MYSLTFNSDTTKRIAFINGIKANDPNFTTFLHNYGIELFTQLIGEFGWCSEVDIIVDKDSTVITKGQNYTLRLLTP